MIGVKLVDVEFKSMVAVDVEKLGDAIIDRLAEKEAEFLCVTLIKVEVDTPEKALGFLAEAKIEFLGVTLIGVTAKVPSKPLVK